MIISVKHISENEAEKYTPLPLNQAIISITDRADRPAKLSDTWSFIKRFGFYDLDKRHFQSLEGTDYKDHIFTKAQALEMCEYIRMLHNHHRPIMLIVHCGAGISRSAAVAMFVAETFNLNLDKRRAELYNRHVYSTLYYAWRGNESESYENSEGSR